MLTRGRRRFATCGHHGFGSYCRRCAKAEEFDQRAKLGSANEDDARRYREEAARLRGPQASRTKTTVAAGGMAVAPGSTQAMADEALLASIRGVVA